MTIKDIARISGVSVSTVSKVVNNKDAGISNETRDKVLKIVREYQYVPYNKVLMKKEKSFLIGIGINTLIEGYPEFIKGAQRCADDYRYNVVLSNITENYEENQYRMTLLSQRNLDGILIDSEYIDDMSQSNSNVVLGIGFNGKNTTSDNLSINYHHAGVLAMKRLLDEYNRSIAVILPAVPISYEDSVLNGINEVCFNSNIRINKNRVFRKSKTLVEMQFRIREMVKNGVNSFVCISGDVAKTVIDIMNLDVTLSKQVSIIGVGKKLERKIIGKTVDWVDIPYEKIGYNSVKYLINQIEDIKPTSFDDVEILPKVIYGDSINSKSVKRRILVAGSINMDVMISVSKIPSPGEVVLSTNNTFIPGGKAANQAIGASKLGADVTLIGKIGNDQEGKLLLENLLENNVNTEGVLTDNEAGTGKAYIYVPENDDSGLIVYGGANNRINKEYIMACDSLFHKQEYCLVQTEIPMEAVETIVKLSKDNQVKTILKPSAVPKISDNILNDLFMIIPNEKEIHTLIPGEISVEEKAYEFIKKGVKYVIVTLGHKGCFYTDGKVKKHYKAADFRAVDTTGAADAFISGLAVYLTEGENIENAIKFATYCGGITTTRQGVQPALPERMSVDMYSDLFKDL